MANNVDVPFSEIGDLDKSISSSFQRSSRFGKIIYIKWIKALPIVWNLALKAIKIKQENNHRDLHSVNQKKLIELTVS